MLKLLPSSRCALAALAAAGASLLAVAPASAQVVVAGFEGATPFASVPGVVTIARAGDTGVQTAAYGIAPTEGSQNALLTTFSNGNGAYPAGSPVFGGSGALSAAGLWGSMFPGSTTNGLTAASFVSGSAITLTITMAVGNTVSFDWNFLTSEDFATGNPDAGFVGVRLGTTGNPLSFTTLGGVTAGMAATPGAVPHFDFMSGPNTFTFTAATAGSYTFAIGVADSGVEGIQSGLLVDNFRLNAIPEPTTFAFAVAGLGALALIRRRRA